MAGNTAPSRTAAINPLHDGAASTSPDLRILLIRAFHVVKQRARRPHGTGMVSLESLWLIAEHQGESRHMLANAIPASISRAGAITASHFPGVKVELQIDTIPAGGTGGAAHHGAEFGISGTPILVIGGVDEHTGRFARDDAGTGQYGVRGGGFHITA